MIIGKEDGERIMHAQQVFSCKTRGPKRLASPVFNLHGAREKGASERVRILGISRMDV